MTKTVFDDYANGDYSTTTRKSDTITIEQFIAKHNLKFECRRVESRPDGLMSDTRPEAGTMRHFRCKVTHDKPCLGFKIDEVQLTTRKSFSVYFSQGSVHMNDPTLANVLDCLASDASGFETARPMKNEYNENQYDWPMHFSNWAEEYGYDTDSRKAEKTFKAIKRQSEQLRRTLGAEAFEELLYNTERL